MFILEFLLTIFYFVIIVLIILLVIALAIPFGVLVLVYWILFRSWRRNDRGKKIKFNKSRFNTKDIKSVINKAMKRKKSNVESEEFENDINEYIEEAIKSSNIEDE